MNTEPKENDMRNATSNVSRFTVQVHEGEQQNSEYPHVVAIHDPEQPDGRAVFYAAPTLDEANEVAETARAVLLRAAELDARARDSVTARGARQ
jgi:hypothetical protein